MNDSILIKIAKDAIQARLSGETIDTNTYRDMYPELKEKQATFVTLTRYGALRGCIGSLIAHRDLIDDLVSNAQAAAFEDPRFKPISDKEFQDTKIEVSLLSRPEQIVYSDASSLKQIIVPKVDGVILKLGNQQATFLPQVWEQLRDFDAFFSHLGMKAGIGDDPLMYHPEVYVYHVKKIEE